MIEVVIVHAEEAADVDQAVFLTGHGAAVGIAHHFFQNFADGFVFVFRLAFFDEVSVFDAAGRVKHHFNAVFAAKLVDGAHVFHADRLTACQVYGNGNANIRNLVGTDFVNQRLQFLDIDIAFERQIRLGIVRLVDDDVAESRAIAFLVRTGSGEVHVARNIVARFDHDGREQVFCTTALVGRDDVFEAVVFTHDFFQVVEVAAARIGFVTNHQASPLFVAHRAGAAVGQEVDVNIFGIKQERVVTRFFHVFLTLFAIGHGDRFNRFDFERLGRVFFRIVVAHG